MNRRNIKEDVNDKVVGSTISTANKESISSVDSQIDAMLIKYEAAAIGKVDMMESLKKRNLMFLLEAEEPAAEEPAAEASPEAEEPDETAAPAAPAAPAPTAPAKKMSINIDSFASSVARLVTNAHNLLQVEPAVINRARNFIDKNYGQEYVAKFDDIFETQYQFNLDGESEVINVPISVGAAGKSA